MRTVVGVVAVVGGTGGAGGGTHHPYHAQVVGAVGVASEPGGATTRTAHIKENSKNSSRRNLVWEHINMFNLVTARALSPPIPRRISHDCAKRTLLSGLSFYWQQA